ncbi:hypothetical protein EVA_14772 [gut metagenome]|uniref:Uncharacterized protein n=1 Tax=gut metagenome TaxID=749906 RepID=J9FQA8_9ZZZZ
MIVAVIISICVFSINFAVPINQIAISIKLRLIFTACNTNVINVSRFFVGAKAAEIAQRT